MCHNEVRMKRLTVLILFTFLGSRYLFAQTPDLAGSYYHFSLARMHELREEYRTIAERRVRLGLLLSEVGQINNVTVAQDEIGKAMMERAREFPGQEETIIKFYRENPEALAELRAPLFEEKVVDLILKQTKVTEKPVSLEELVRDPDAEAAGDAATKKKKPAAKKKAASKKTGAKKKPAAKKKSAKKD